MQLANFLEVNVKFRQKTPLLIEGFCTESVNFTIPFKIN